MFNIQYNILNLYILLRRETEIIQCVTFETQKLKPRTEATKYNSYLYIQVMQRTWKNKVQSTTYRNKPSYSRVNGCICGYSYP